MRLFKRILPIFLLILAVVTIASCKKDTKTTYTYPNPVPLYTSEDAFVTVDGLTVTKKDVYNKLLVSYGVDTLKHLVDNKLMADYTLTAEQQAEFNEYLNEIIYGTEDLNDDEKAEALKKFKTQLLTTGLHDTEQTAGDIFYYENYYLLQYKKQMKALDVLKAEVEAHDAKAKEDNSDLYFLDDDYVTFFNTNFHRTYNAIIVTFESELEALAAMKAAGIDTTNLFSWSDSKDAIKSFFVTMAESDVVTTYTHEDLLKIAASSTQDGTIAAKVAKLSTDDVNSCYTHAPLSYNGRWFLAFVDSVSSDYFLDSDDTVKIADTEITDATAEGVAKELSEAAKTALYPLLLENELSASSAQEQNVTERIFLKLRQDAGLEIFAEGLEINYKSNYESTFSNLGITDYDAFKATSNTSSTVVAKLNNFEITVDDMYNALTNRYGALITLLFLEQYAILGSDFNKVLDYKTREIKDAETYANYVKEDFTTYKESFEKGDFEANGFPAAYGWDNFLRDYLGATGEYDVVVDFDSTLYNDVLALYTKALYLAEAGDVELFVPDEAANEWYLKSSKWTKEYGTTLETSAVKEGTTPTLSLAFEEADVAKVERKTDDQGNEIALKVADYYGHFVITYTNTEDKEVAMITEVTTDQAVLEKYDEIYNETFSATVVGFYAYVDSDHDGVFDEIEDKDTDDAQTLSDKANLRAAVKELTEQIWDLAYAAYNEEQTNKNYPRQTVIQYLTAAIRKFETDTTGTFDNFKKQGIRVGTVNSVTYTRTTSASEELLATVKAMWTKIKETSSSVMGQSLDPVYRWIENDVVNTLKAMAIADEYEAVLSNNAYYHLAVTKATASTAYSYSSSSVTQTPNYYLYTEYQKDSADRAVTVYCSSQFTSYYNPAIAALSSTTIVSKATMTDCKALLAKVTFADNATANLAALTALIDAALEEVA